MTDSTRRASPPQALRQRLVALRYMLVASKIYQRRLLQDMLTAFGAGMPAHSDGLDDACRTIRQHRPDIVLWDWETADLDGLKRLNREALNMPQRASIILLAASPSTELVAAAVMAGAAGIVAKPFSANVVMSQVAHAMAQRTRQFLLY